MRLKKILSMLTVMAMLLSSVGFTVFSEETEIVAYIGEEGYESVQAAIEEAKDGDIVTLISDVEMTDSVVISSKALTLDLGEYTIYDKNTNVLTKEDDIWGLIALESSAKLTICGNGTIECNYTVTGNGWTGMAYAIDVDATSELTVNSGCFTNGNGAIQTYGKVTVNNATFVSHNGGTCIMALGSSANVTVNDGVFKDSIAENDVYTGSGAVWGGFDATININGGVYDFVADPEHENIVWTLFPAQNAISGYGSNASMTVSGGTFVNFNPTTDAVVNYSPSTGFTFGSVVAEGYAVLADLDGNYVVGAKPAATVNDFGATVIPAGEYGVWNGSFTEGTTDMPLSFVMQFLADQDADDMSTSPFADWYADFVLSFTGIENGSFTADGCYLAGHYGSFGWVKVPVDGMTIEDGVRYPVMLGVGLGQKYDYVCSGVQDFKCALYLTPEVLEANPNLKVNLELAVVDNSKGGDAATEALINNENIYKASETAYTAEDFKGYVAQIGETKYTSLQTALDAAAAGTGNITVEILEDINLTNVDWTPVTVSAPGYPVVTVNGNNKTITGLNDMLFAGTWAGGSGLIINDLTIADSNIVNDENDAKGTVGVGAFIGYPQASATITLNNCHLLNSTVKGGHWTGGLIGMAGGYNGNDGPVFMNLTITGCSVTDSTITGKGSVGGIIGHGSCAAWTNVVIEDTTVSGNTITSTGSSTNKAGSVMGTIGAAGQSTTANGETKTGGASVSATVSDNTVTSNGTAITTIYGRQGTQTGMLYVTGGTYDNYPIQENVAYAQPKEGYEIVRNENDTYGLKEVKLFEFYGSNVKLGNSLAMNFAIEAENFVGTDYYAVIEHVTDTATETINIPFEEWTLDGNYYVIRYSGIVARQITDDISITIFDKNGTQVSVKREDGLKAYALRMLENSSETKLKTTLVDMLNYGAAAQLEFNYKTDDLANADLTQAQKAYASEMPSITNENERDPEKCVGSNLILVDNIKMNMAFEGITEGMYVEYEYTNHHGEKMSKRVRYSDLAVNNEIYRVLTIDTFVIADAGQIVTATVHNSDGSVYTVCKDSMNSYIARQLENSDLESGLYSAIAKFTASSYNYLH